MIASTHAKESELGNPKNKIIHVRCNDGEINVYLDWGHAIDEDYGLEAHFDGRHSLGELAISQATDPKTAFIHLSPNQRQRLLSLLKKSNTLMVRLHNWPGQSLKATFSLAGSYSAIGEVERFCSRVQEEKTREAAKQASLYEAEYRAIIGRAVRRHWVPPANAPDVKCRIRVKKFPDGEVITAEVINSCGSTALNGSVIDAVYQASPLPKPKDPYLFAREVTFEFSSL
jgi:hypothetical protein